MRYGWRITFSGSGHVADLDMRQRSKVLRPSDTQKSLCTDRKLGSGTLIALRAPTLAFDLVEDRFSVLEPALGLRLSLRRVNVWMEFLPVCPSGGG